MKIANLTINENSPTIIIAEAGVNHNGDIKLAEKLIDSAYECGCDIVKFQTYNVDNLLLKDASKPKYQKRNTPATESQYEMLKRLQLDFEDFNYLHDYAKDRNIVFLSTPYDEPSVNYLDSIGVPAFKLASIEIVNHPLIEYTLGKKKPLILSTAMSTLDEIDQAYDLVKRLDALDKLVFMQCTFNYPAALDEINLRVIPEFIRRYNIPIGFSDHTGNTITSCAAVALGAKIIETHFTLDKTLPGPDHRASLNPSEMKTLVSNIRDIEQSLGQNVKEPTVSEKPSRKISRKSIVAKKKIAKGVLLSREFITEKRPGSGLYPTYANIDHICTKKARREIQKDEIILLDMLE